jgi:hypothetical protein
MPSQTIDDFKNYIEQVRLICSYSIENFEYSDYMYRKSKTHEFAIIQGSSSMSTIRHATIRISILELSKLLGKSSHKYNINSLLNSLINGEYGFEFKNNDELKVWQIKLSNTNATIEKLIKLRDKEIAHTDNLENRMQLEDITYNEIESLLMLTKDFINYVWQQLHGINAVFISRISEWKYIMNLLVRGMYGKDYLENDRLMYIKGFPSFS